MAMGIPCQEPLANIGPSLHATLEQSKPAAGQPRAVFQPSSEISPFKGAQSSKNRVNPVLTG